MASNMQSFPRMLKMLRENSNIKEKREALTYIRSNSKKLESTQVIKEEQYKELCKLIVDAFANGNNDIQNEAYETLNVVIQEFKDHTLNLFEAISQISRKHRLKILKLLEVVEENAISTFVHDPHAVNFFNNCMCAVQTNTMPWIAPTACVDNLQALIDAESSKPLSDDQRLEEETVNYCITFLRRLYKVAAVTSDIKVQRFNAILIDKVMILAYMGHKRQRGPALKLLQQALTANILPHVRTKLASAWTRYIEALQSTYCKRMLLLVSACELDWATQWNVSIQFLGVDLHRGAGLINNLLSVEEKAFKSTDTIIRRQAFLSWKLLVDNFALDPHELASARRIKLLCIPLNAKNSKTELIALTKLEVWWHVIIKLYKDISKFVNPVITQFLNFCFGPLGDTPLLSSKFDIVASPGKRFFKTKVVAVDALYQFLVSKQENHTAPVLEERLPYPISDAIFQECYKSIIHSVGEVLLVFSQLTDEEMKNRYQVGKILWKSLVNYIRESKLEDKSIMYKDITLVITELTNYAKNKPMIRNLILDTILFEIADLSIDFNFQDDTLSKLVFKLLQIPILNEAKKDHYNALKCLFWQCIKSQKENIYYSHAFNCLKEMYEKLHALLNIANKNESIIFELWLMLGDVLGKYMSDIQEINEGTTTEHNLKTVQSIVVFPFMYIHLQDQKQIQELAKAWKYLYKHFEMRTDLITTVKSNEILLSIASIMQHSITKNKESPYLTIYCLDILLSTINYKLLLVNTEIPSVIHLIVDLILYFLSEKEAKECELALKAMSATIITIYGHNPEKITPYLQVCKSVIELILQSELEMLNKEVANTWESIISIFKELGKVINYDLFSSYKKLIIQALNHSNVDIQIQTASLFESKNVFSDSIKLLLEEIEKETGKDKILNIAEITKKKHAQIEKLPNQIKIVGSFLKGSNSPNLIVKESDKNMDKNTGKKASIDSDSQDYVFIKTDLKFDVNRLTEHQKESLKRRREDIPALYNDLSQSSSQDTQNLQEWFDKKNKIFEETEKENNKKDNVSIKNILDDDANKENKIEIQELETINKSFIETDTKSMDSVERNIALESVQKTKVNVDNNEILLIEKQTAIVENAYDNAEAKTSADFVSKNLDTNIQEELKNKDDQRLSPSVLDNSKRRNRFNITVKSTLPKSEEIVSNQPEQYSNTTEVLQRTLRTKVIQSKSETTNKQKASENMENKSTKEDRRGIKRKLDNENEGTNLRQRRKLMDTTSDVDSCKSSENDKISINEANLSQRTRNEISRLRINMVFDTPLSTSRRSKSHEDTKDKEFIAKKYSIENKNAKLKAGDIKVSDAKKVQKLNDKELKVKAKPGRKRSDEKYLIKKDKKNESEEQKKVEEKKKEEIKHVEVISKNTTDNKCDSFDEKSIESNDDVKLNESKSHTQDDMEDVIEDSQGLSKLGRNRLLKVKLEINKIEDIKKISQHNKNELKEEIDKEKDEKKQKETVQTEIISKNIDNKCDLLDTKKSIKINVEIVNNNNNNNNNNQNNNDNHNNNNNHNHNNINDDIKSDSNIQTINQDHESIEGKSQIQDDMEDIIENSQESSELEKKYDEKQYFIKINRIEDISSSMKCHEITIEDEEVSEIILNNCDNDNIEVPKDNIKEFEETNEINMIEPKISSSVIENNLCDNEKDTIVDVQKVNDGLVSKSLLEFSSPKSTMKRQAKFKSYSSYSTQGRAAHMIGLVTKQARMETESCVINLDDELVGKKIKSKDTDNDILLGKKEQGSVLKEADKITALCSSRQEKIFNNMRSTDYCPSPPIKLFSNLKNDGEKIFSKTDKSIDNALIQNDIQTDKIGEETLETDELPILEWSNANPPSLNASPSASILKRQRQYFPESDSDITPNKRKRVSFADPPVSKEMGYEITSTDSPHKINKFTSRGLLARKDSSLKLKQIKQKLTSVDSDKLEKSEEIDMTNVSEVDLQCERENELLTKIAEELEYSENVTIDSDVQTSCDSAENESINTVPIIVNKDNNIKINNLNVEFEITQHIESISTNKIDQNKEDKILERSKNNINLENNEFNDSATQTDIFGIDAKETSTETSINIDTNAIQNTSIKNNTLDLLKFNENDSIIEHSSEKCINSENLEDTADAANLTELNSSANLDEIFCGKLIRTSTQSTENLHEQDTLPVTDSVFGSLPLSQDSQCTNEFNIEIPHPELLDSIQPIYPTLISCKEPITSIIEHLTNPLWVQHLSTYFINRNIQSIGDLAQLSEREINRIPVKGNSKIEFVKSVLKCFEKKYISKELNNTMENIDNVLNNEISRSVNINVLSSTLKVSQDQILKDITTNIDETHNKLNHNVTLNQPSSSRTCNVIITDKNTETTVSKSSDITSSDIIQIINIPISPKIVTTSENIIGNSIPFVRSAISSIQTTKTVGTCTSSDSIYLSKTGVNKATKSVAAQMALEDLLDEIDVNLVLESAARRCTPDKLLIQYKDKMRHVSQVELETETIKILGAENRKNCNEITLKAACRACGINKVLLRLPDIFSTDKQFFVKVLNAYKKKIKTSDCMDILDFNEVKDAVCQKCTSSEFAEMLSKKLKEEEQEGIRKPMTELSSLDAMLKRMPMDVIISHTVANDELIPSRVVLDIALQNNSPTDIIQALESQSSVVTQNVFNKLWSSQFAIEYINQCKSKEDLLKIFKAISLKLSQQDLLQAFYESMNVKLMVKQEND